MIIDSHDVAELSNAQLELLVDAIKEAAADRRGPVATFYRSLEDAVRQVLRVRNQSLLLLEADAMNHDGPGAIVS